MVVDRNNQGDRGGCAGGFVILEPESPLMRQEMEVVHGSLVRITTHKCSREDTWYPPRRIYIY